MTQVNLHLIASHCEREPQADLESLLCPSIPRSTASEMCCVGFMTNQWIQLGLSGGNFGRKDSGNALRAFPGISLEGMAGIPQTYNSRHLKPPEHLQNSPPLSTAGDASFSEVVPERASQSWSWNSQQC